MALTVSKVVKLKEELKERDAARNDSYDEVLRFYGGATLKDIKRQGYVPGVEQALSSIFTPKEGDEDASLTAPINLVKPAIENKVAFLAMQPIVKVVEPPDSLAPSARAQGPAGAPPMAAPTGDETGFEQMLGEGEQPMGANPTGEPPAAPSTAPSSPASKPEDDWGMNFADRLEQAIVSLLAGSNMPKRCRDVAWSMCAMDGAVIGVWPDFRHGRPRIFTRTPQDFYPVSYDPDGLELTKAVWVEEMNGHDIEARWGTDKYIGRTDVEVTQCIDEEKFYTVLDDKVWAHPPIPNPLGFVPIVCVGSLGLPGMVFGSTDIKDAAPVAKQLNYHMYLVDSMAAAMVNPTIFITDPLNVPPDLAIGKGGVATAGPTGKVDLLGPIDLPNAFWGLGQTLQQWFDMIADNPNALRSDAGAGWVTGKGFNAQLGPIAARMQTRLDILMMGWTQVIKYMLMMWANFPGSDKTQKFSGTQNGQLFYIEANPQEFILDGSIWTEIQCSLSAQSYMDRQGAAIELIQLYQNELIDWRTVVDNIPYIVDRSRCRRNIDKDREWKAKGMQIAQGMASSPATANVDIGAQQRTNYGLERGFIGEAGAPPGPEARPEAAGLPTQEEEPPDILGILQEFFAGIQKLQGEVYIGGDPVSNPDSLAGDNWTVTVWITVPQDKGTITQAAKQVPEIYGHIKFIQGKPGPEDNAIQVAGGGQESPTLQEAPMPEMEGLMGGM